MRERERELRGRGRERMGKERDAKQLRSSNEEGAEMRSLIYRWIMMKGGGISEWCGHYLWVAS